MSHPLHDRLRRLAGRARTLTLLHGTSWFLVTAAVAFLAIGGVDFLLRSDELPLRMLASIAMTAAVVWGYLRFLNPALKQRLTDLQLASRVEQRFPQLRGLVTSTVAFLGERADDPLAGSFAMRRAVVSQAMADLEDVELSDCLDAKSSRRACFAAAGVLLVLTVLFAFLPQPTTHAASRLLTPWAHQPWPRRNALRFVDPPTRLARGGDLEVEIIDANGRLPEDAMLQLRHEDGRLHERSTVFVGGKMMARVNNVSKSFEYRAVGGDDDTMPWRMLEVVAPPELQSMQVSVTPPAYSGLPETNYTGDARALVGSQLRVAGGVDQRLRAADLRFLADDAASESPRSITLEVAENTFRAEDEPLVVDKSGQFWIDLIDHRGVRSGEARKWNLRAVVDQPPVVTLDAANITRYVTPQSIAPLVAVAEDDLALAEAVLVFRRLTDSDAAAETVTLWRGPEQPPQHETSEPDSDRRELRFEWRIDSIVGLSIGDSVEFHIAAKDYAGQEGLSPTTRLTIVSQSELEDRLARDQGYILERIAEGLRSQHEARKQVESLQIQLRETKSFSKADADQLQSAELNQRQVTRSLAGPQDGALSLLDRLRADIANNRLNNPELDRRVKQLVDAVGDAVELLPQIQRPLLGAAKDVRPKLLDADEDTRVEAPPQTSGKLADAADKQGQVIEQLEQLLGEMAKWENYRRFAREIGRLQREQADLEQRTDDVRLQTLSRDWESLTPEQRAQLLRLGQEQVGLAQRLDKLQSRMSRASEQLADDDPLAAETLSDGAEAAQRLAISGRMREIARRLGSNQVGQAKQIQDEVKDSLSELLSVLGNRREDELDRKLRKQNELQGTLNRLQAEEQSVADQLDALADADQPDQRELQRLSAKQAELAEQAQQAARRLQRLEASRPAQAMEAAGQAMQASSQAGEQQDPQEAAQQARSALEQLEQAKQQLQQQQQQTQQDLLFERMVRLEQNLQGLVQRQTSINETIHELLIAEQVEPLSRVQQTTLKNLGGHQADLGLETSSLADQVAEAKVFELALRSASREMARCGKFLEELQLADAKQAGDVALARLNQLLVALKQDPPPENQPQQPPNQQGGGQPQSQPPEDAISQLAQLKLVKLLQQEILRRTEVLEQLSEESPLSPDQLQEYEDLSAEQGRLADLLDDLIKSAEEAASAAEAASEDPTANPDEPLDQLLLDDLQGDSPGDSLENLPLIQPPKPKASNPKTDKPADDDSTEDGR